MIQNIYKSMLIYNIGKNMLPKFNQSLSMKNNSFQFSSFQSIKFGVNPMKKTQIFSLTNQDISQLSSISHYITSIQYLQQNNLQKSLQFLNFTLNQAKNKYPESINLQMCLLNRISIILKLLHRLTQFVQTLEQIFFLSFSFKGPRSLDTEKNLNNYLLSLTYYNLQKLKLVIEFIKENQQFNKIKLKNMQFYKVLTEILVKNNHQDSLQHLNNLPETNAWEKSFKFNNIGWLKFVSIRKKSQNQQVYYKTLKRQAEFILKNFIKALIQLQTKSSSNEMRKLNQVQTKNNIIFTQTLENYLLEKTNVLRVSLIKLAHPQSHVVSMNIGNLLFQCGRYQQSVIFMKLSLNTALDLNQIHRVGLCLILLSKMNFKSGNNWEEILLSMLQNIERYPKQIARQCLLTYSKFLYKEGRFVEAQNYGSQVSQIQGNVYLQGLILSEYDFSF